MGEVLVGTSGYSYEDWVGPFYPPNVKSDRFLSYYAEHFPMTELNFSYYRQPSASTIQGMVDRTPNSFRFSIKAHRSMTHDVGGGWRDDADSFVDGIAPLIEHRRLLGVLLQFPYRFHYTVGNRRYLAALCRVLESLPLFLEFRHKEWQRRSVYDQMREMGLGLVLTDMPALRGLPDAPVARSEHRLNEAAPGSATEHQRGTVNLGESRVTDRSYIRFHGRNEANWWEGDSTSRYDYRYSQEELAAWLPVISKLKNDTSLLVIAFNNHANGNAVINARQLMGMLSQ
jgi:uncharacterized protein YecE (DUF72 family)